MSIKTLLAIIIFSLSYSYAQNTNTTANIAKDPAPIMNKAANVYVNRPKELPTPTPIPSNTTIRGKVFYEDDGKPVRRSVVVFFKLKGGGEPQTLTDENGNFEIKNIQAGSYFPMAFSAGIVNLFSSLDFEKLDGPQNEREVFVDASRGFQEVIADGKTNLEIKLPVKRGGAIGGKVTYSDGTPAIGRPIQLLRKVNGKLQPVISDFFCLAQLNTSNSASCYQTDDRGMYRFTGLPAGEYFIRVSEPTFHGGKFSRYIGGPNSAMAMMFGVGTFLNTYYPDTIDSEQAKSVKIELGKEQKDVNVTIPEWKLYKISGKVVSSKDGKPVKARVYISQKNNVLTAISFPNSDSFRPAAETDENGNWIFKEIPRGQYTIQIEPINADSYNYASNTYNTVSNAANYASNTKRTQPSPPLYANMMQDVTVENSDVENVEIKAYLSAKIMGNVVVSTKTRIENGIKIEVFNESNKKIAQTTVYAYEFNENPTNNQFINRFEVDKLPKGKIKLAVTLRDSDLIVKSVAVNGVDLLKDFVELKEGQILMNVKIVLEKKN